MTAPTAPGSEVITMKTTLVKVKKEPGKKTITTYRQGTLVDHPVKRTVVKYSK